VRLALFALALGASIAFADDGRGIDVGFDETKTIVWLDDGHASWNAYAGDLQALRDTGIYTQVVGSLVDRSCDLDVPRFRYDTTPEPGHCAFLLVSGNGAVEGGLGTDSSGGIRPRPLPRPRRHVAGEPQ